MLSRKAKYAINALVYLTKNQAEGPLLIEQIAREEMIPKKFLELILLDLKNAGILDSKRGKGGGYFLLKAPSEVNVAEIIRLMDGPIALLPCVSSNFYEKCPECKDENLCGIRKVFSEVRAATLQILAQSSLEDIVKQERNLP